ncbi:MAG: hypothetical protein K1X89_20500 [Myxococcaceae bacterium]|nr:hypothetical protein [Myxococcaceae bacterium]
MRRFGTGVGLGLLLAAATAFAQNDREAQVREELEQQLKALVGTPPTKIMVEFVGLDQPIYKLLEASFVLDGQKLPVSDLAKLDSEGAHLVFHGDVKPGQHQLVTELHYENQASQVVSSEGGFKWKLASTVSFANQAGLEVQVKVTPALDLSATDVKGKLKLASPTSVRMLAKLDDGSMPPPPPKPVVAPPDAGVAVAAAEKPKTKAELAAEAAAAKKQAREEALAAQKAALEEKKRAAAEAAEARRLKIAAAAESKRMAQEDAARKAQEAKAARLAAQGKLPPPPVDLPLKTPEPPPAEKPVEPPVAAVVDAGPPEPVAVPAEVDAGAPVVAAAEPPAPVAPAPAPSETSPWLCVGIGGVIAVLALAWFISQRRSKPPSID